MNAASVREDVLNIQCEGARLWGILSRPPAGVLEQPHAVLIVVGGPQYRVGSHRQFVLLARSLAARGFASLRFDCRGMGDSEGGMRTFEGVAPDLHRAVDALLQACPDAPRIVVWGLCDAASAAMMHATSHDKVVGIVAVNPWARTVASLAAARVRFYYAERIMQREFWIKLLRGGLDWRHSVGGLLGNLKQARSANSAPRGRGDGSFQTRMAHGIAGFRGRMLLVIAGNDLTAKEFLQFTQASPAWKDLLSGPKVERFDVPDADHTFSSRSWRGAVEEATAAWLERLSADTLKRS